jgi:hypothetical protein
MVLGFPAVLLLAGDHKDLLAGAGLAKPSDIRGGDVALAVGCGTQQSQVIDPPMLHSARAARCLAEEHERDVNAALADKLDELINTLSA